MRFIMGTLLSLATIAFSAEWILLYVEGRVPAPWQISTGLILISLVLFKSSVEEIYMWSRERNEKKQSKKVIFDMHERMSNETAKLYAKAQEEERMAQMKADTVYATSLKEVLDKDGKEISDVEEGTERLYSEEKKVKKAQ